MSKGTGNIKTWLILGGSSSVARAFARRAAAAGADILLAGRDIEDLERTASDIAIRHAVKTEGARIRCRGDKSSRRFYAEAR